MRFNDDTTIRQFAAAVLPDLERVEGRGETTRGQGCLARACAFAVAHPESQTARDLLAWAHGSTPGGCVEGALAQNIEEWIAGVDMPAFDAMETFAEGCTADDGTEYLIETGDE